MYSWILWALATCSFSLLMAGMSKHQRDLFKTPVTKKRTRLFQISGWILLGVSLLAGIFWWGPSVGISRWSGVVTFAALVVALVMTYRPLWLARVNLGIVGWVTVFTIF